MMELHLLIDDLERLAIDVYVDTTNESVKSEGIGSSTNSLVVF